MKKPSLPKHIGIIVDGNRRWAKKHHLDCLEGHKYVTDHILEDIVFHCLDLEIPYLTFWAFSTENWKRGADFYKPLFQLLRSVLKKDVKKYLRAGVSLNVIGDLTKIPLSLRKLIKKRLSQKPDKQKIVVTIALNYGGRDEIIRAVNQIISRSLTSKNKLTKADFEAYLDTSDLPDPDLIIRTGGAQRTSGFMPWQAVYAEWYFTDTLMPDFNLDKFDQALEDFKNRQRRFGK